MTEPPWDDGIADALALTEAVREDRVGHVAVILRHCNSFEVAVVLAKLLAAVADESDATREHLRKWGQQTARRP